VSKIVTPCATNVFFFFFFLGRGVGGWWEVLYIKEPDFGLHYDYERSQNSYANPMGHKRLC